ncbi:MAG: hypothetical protein HYS17_08675 [Micavibrio aeruginosavorus]|uniref:Lipoprotein n=1 Tax=Micavibrio aeruginosavorus TaxID=349221 RepID=A0A7T5R183_9BACT|nr:MAG: hypothetical protein HYS17_08675 [Micavibrio aeruginosavorus]
MIRQLRYAAVAFLLASCSTLVDGQIQDVTIETQGAKNTLCYMQNRDFSFRFYPPQTLKVTKSPDPYTIRCLAPGNREKTVVVEPKTPDSTFFNISNAGTGVAVDHLSAAMYELPDKIVISFEGMQPQSYPQPPYNEFFDDHPELKGVEEFRPGQPALMRDGGTTVPGLTKREDLDAGSGTGLLGADAPAAEKSAAPVTEVVAPPVPSNSKSMSADSLTKSMNPHIFGGFSTPAAIGAPVDMTAPSQQ